MKTFDSERKNMRNLRKNTWPGRKLSVSLEHSNKAHRFIIESENVRRNIIKPQDKEKESFV